ncbi:DUF2271 domain-containing protein [Paludisphaera borealis]|uniref:FAD:protein FMN transferase n=1 Tax=Paludisphaera borealis TaxID=1387353 RepID=A0A1U7CU84_9BACT|nr:DUF2271 domain-containing protein [Paludisphaera borealis]APW62504.1 FAD:protein FMN transferase [Paludisphaera borealis]
MKHPHTAPPRRPFRLLTCLVLGLGCLTAGASADEPHVFSHESVMGTSLELRVWADGRDLARDAEARVLGEIDRLSAILSGYDPNSEFSRWRRATGRPMAVSPPLWDLLQAADAWRTRSAGAFDPRVEILSKLWTESAANGREPSADATRQALDVLASPAWRLDADARTAAPLSECPLSLNAIAKGYIVERACDAAMKLGGVRGLVLNVGGDLRAVGEAVGAIGVVDPLADSESSTPLTVIEVPDRAVASSGRSQRGFSINGRWHSHIFDPRTGQPVEAVAGATVVAPRSADADALATICNVLTPDESLGLVDATADAACLIVLADGRTVRSARWTRYEHPAFAQSAASPVGQEPKPAKAEKSTEAEKPAAAPWNADYELAVDFEINNPSDAGRRYRRPYVAVWVEDKEGRPVRNLILWLSQGGAGPFQWVPDLKRWYRADQLRKQTDKREMIFTMARATRAPGKYKVVWDGKNDLGKLAPQGDYTIFIEAVREHGTYQSIRKDVTLAATPFTEDLKGNVEIKSATIAYRRKPEPKK